jgi:DNA-binding CsgD family transcriptional regulator
MTFCGVSLVQKDGDEDILIPSDEVVKIVKLLGSIAGMTCDLPERKRILMAGLCQILDADGWLWSATQVIENQNRPVSVGVLYDGLTHEEFSGWVEASQLACQQPPEDAPLTRLALQGQHFTRTRQQVVPDEVWYQHPTVKQYRLNRGINHFLYSIYPLSPSHCSAIGFFRRVGREPFTALQRRICHIVVANVEWLHRASFPEHRGEKCTLLTPRLRTVLIFLLGGKQRDEIAKLLHISPDTVKTHIRNIYRHFSVNSQVELMRYFQAGDGRDRENISISS